MEVNKVKELFNEKFYKPTYQDWRIDEIKAGKDIVGKNYEDFRKDFWESHGFEVSQQKKLFGIFDVDTLVYKNGELVAIEEDKGHYVVSQSRSFGKKSLLLFQFEYVVGQLNIKCGTGKSFSIQCFTTCPRS